MGGWVRPREGRRVAAGLLLSLLAACRLVEAPRDPPAVDSVDGPGIRVIDAHVHAEFSDAPDPLSGLDASRTGFVEAMRRANVVASVSMGARGQAELEDLSDLGVIQCGGVDVPPDTAALGEGLRSGRFHCLKIYLGYVARYADDPVYEGVYALAALHRVPVVFHTGDTSTNDARIRYADPLVIDDVAVDHRDVTFVLAHAGNPWIQTAAEIAYKNPNVYIDASALMIGDPATSDPAWVERYVVEPIRWMFGYIEDPSKVMFASDWPLVDVASYVEVYKRAIPPEHWQAVLHDNAARVFGIEEAISRTP
jgi:hypothetical protein